MIIFLTFNSEGFTKPLDDHFHVRSLLLLLYSNSFDNSISFLNYFAIIFGAESRIRKEALNKMEEVMAKEHEMLSLRWTSCCCSTFIRNTFINYKIISQELMKQLKDQKDVIQDIELLSSQVERCNQILKKLSLNPNEEDDFIDEDLKLKEYLKRNYFLI